MEYVSSVLKVPLIFYDDFAAWIADCGIKGDEAVQQAIGFLHQVNISFFKNEGRWEIVEEGEEGDDRNYFEEIFDFRLYLHFFHRLEFCITSLMG
jgi:hypothetical protein